MIEFLVLIIGVVILWKFSASLNSSAIAMEEATKGWSESIIKDTVVERQELSIDFDKDVELLKESNPAWDGNIISSDDILKKFKVK